MSDANSLSREGLLQVLNLAKPALANQPFVPILTHFCFDGAWVLAYNDVQAIGARYSAGIECAVPGDLLIKLINSLQGNTLELKETPEALLLTCGRAKLKLPTLPVQQFTFDFPSEEPTGVIEVSADFIRGVEKCLTSAGNDPTHPAQMGITVEPGDDNTIVMYSTDNVTVCRYRTTGDCDLADDGPIILPTFFCQQLVQAAKLFSNEPITIQVYPGAVVAEVGSVAKLFTKLVLDVKPLQFDGIFDRFGVDAAADRWSILPDQFDPALNRCLAILSSSNDKTARIEVSGREVVVSSQSPLGETTDTMPLDRDYESFSFFIDPQLVDRGAAVSTHVAFLPTVLVLGDEKQQFTHLIAHASLV